jgi:hypothetical protein
VWRPGVIGSGGWAGVKGAGGELSEGEGEVNEGL